MNPWVPLVGSLAYNVARHMRGKSTLCSTARPHLPPAAFAAGWGFLTGWIIPHYCTPKEK